MKDATTKPVPILEKHGAEHPLAGWHRKKAQLCGEVQPLQAAKREKISDVF